MSGPAARPEHEDFLASIRRLVSRDLEAANQDGGFDPAPRTGPPRQPDPGPSRAARSAAPLAPAPRPGAVAPLGPSATQGPAPLVLTPEHRVPGRPAPLAGQGTAAATAGGPVDGAPDGPNADPHAADGNGYAPAFRSHRAAAPPPPAATATPAPARAAEAGADPTAGPTEPPPPQIDEALLRTLIADVVREELAGETGRRITSNLRKLVRAEIARAMTSRDLL